MLKLAFVRLYIILCLRNTNRDMVPLVPNLVTNGRGTICPILDMALALYAEEEGLPT
jgi:hypothetical protein